MHKSIIRYNLFLAFFFVVLSTGGVTETRSPHVCGVVRDTEGVALQDIEVSLYDYTAPDFTAEHLISSVKTDTEGRFSLTAADAGKVLLLLTGGKGTGRLLATAAIASEPIRITYPVRTEIILLHDNDLHFNFNHLDAFQERITHYRQKYANVFLLNAGDIFIRHPDRWPYPGEAGYYGSASGMVEIMNNLGYDAMTVGNHELDFISGLTRQALEIARFPILGANVVVSTDNLPELTPFTVLATVERYSIAVLGLSYFNKEGVDSLEPVETAKKFGHLAAGHDVFVALTHIGNSADRRLAAELDVLDVIIGGHTHGLLETAELIGEVLFARAGGTPGGHPVDAALPKYLGVVKIVLENGRIREKSGHVETFVNSPVETEIGENIAPARCKML